MKYKFGRLHWWICINVWHFWVYLHKTIRLACGISFQGSLMVHIYTHNTHTHQFSTTENYKLWFAQSNMQFVFVAFDERLSGQMFGWHAMLHHLNAISAKIHKYFLFSRRNIVWERFSIRIWWIFRILSPCQLLDLFA